MINDPHLRRLQELLTEFSGDFDRLLLHHEGAYLIGHVMIDALEENGFPPEELDAVGGRVDKALPLGLSMLQAAGSRGLDLDVFALYPATGKNAPAPSTDTCAADFTVKGEPLAGKKVAVLSLSPSKGNCLLGVVPFLRAQGAEVKVAAIVARKPGAETSALEEKLREWGIPLVSAFEFEDK